MNTNVIIIKEGGYLTNIMNTNVIIIKEGGYLTNILWSHSTNFWIDSGQSHAETKIVTITNFVTVASSSAPFRFPHIPMTTVIGVVFCLLCIWRLWWLRNVDKRIKAARELAYDQFLSIKNPPHVKRIYE